MEKEKEKENFLLDFQNVEISKNIENIKNNINKILTRDNDDDILKNIPNISKFLQQVLNILNFFYKNILNKKKNNKFLTKNTSSTILNIYLDTSKLISYDTTTNPFFPYVVGGVSGLTQYVIISMYKEIKKILNEIKVYTDSKKKEQIKEENEIEIEFQKLKSKWENLNIKKLGKGKKELEEENEKKKINIAITQHLSNTYHHSGKESNVIALNLLINVYIYNKKINYILDEKIECYARMFIDSNDPIIFITNKIKQRYMEMLETYKLHSIAFNQEVYFYNKLIPFFKEDETIELIKNVNLKDNDYLKINMKIIY